MGEYLDLDLPIYIDRYKVDSYHFYIDEIVLLGRGMKRNSNNFLWVNFQNSRLSIDGFLLFTIIFRYKFDIGIYTIITSVDPLRVYIYNGEALLRYFAYYLALHYNNFDFKSCF